MVLKGCGLSRAVMPEKAYPMTVGEANLRLPNVCRDLSMLIVSDEAIPKFSTFLSNSAWSMPRAVSVASSSFLCLTPTMAPIQKTFQFEPIFYGLVKH